jgi:hypothetical protein
MEAEKLQRYHDTLAKLAPKGHHGGLGRFGNMLGGHGKPRDPTLPNNALYANFVRAGHFHKRSFEADFTETGMVDFVSKNKDNNSKVKKKKKKSNNSAADEGELETTSIEEEQTPSKSKHKGKAKTLDAVSNISLDVVRESFSQETEIHVFTTNGQEDVLDETIVTTKFKKHKVKLPKTREIVAETSYEGIEITPDVPVKKKKRKQKQRLSEEVLDEENDDSLVAPVVFETAENIAIEEVKSKKRRKANGDVLFEELSTEVIANEEDVDGLIPKKKRKKKPEQFSAIEADEVIEVEESDQVPEKKKQKKKEKLLKNKSCTLSDELGDSGAANDVSSNMFGNEIQSILQHSSKIEDESISDPIDKKKSKKKSKGD